MLNRIDLTRIDLNLLVVFEAVFEQRHVGSASRRLHVSSSAVSHGLRRLRAVFGDPMFLRTPKGVVPTARAVELAAPIAEILAHVRRVMGSVAPFSPAASTRRFTLGAPDAILAVLLPQLIARLRRDAPLIDLSTRDLLPQAGLGDLDTGAIDLAILPIDAVPARFEARVVQEDEFVIAARAGHPFLKAPSLRAYCELLHVLVSTTGDRRGYVDDVLASRGLSRRVALTAPNFMLTLALLSESDLLAAVPKSLLATHAQRFGLGSVKAPIRLRRWQLRAIAPKVAMADPGIAWLVDVIEHAAKPLATTLPARPATRRGKSP